MGDVLMNLLPEMEVIIVTPHHYPFGKGRGSGTSGLDPLNVRKEGQLTKRKKTKGDTHFGHTHPALERILIYSFIPVVRIHNSHIIVLEVGREGFVPIQGFGPPIVHNKGGGPLRSGITTGGRRRDERVG